MLASSFVHACRPGVAPRDAQALLTAEDAVISDQLNHASIIDGIRLCKAQRLRHAPLRRAKRVKCDDKQTATGYERDDCAVCMYAERGWPVQHGPAQSASCFGAVGVHSGVQSSARGRAPMTSG